ncbi:FAD-dependent oxidoreductase [Streptomyces sp. UNOC14_S4]|nr:FAD-dependent oxidoreductase [Streptomyces sp. UNOC14_S4]
MIGAAGPEATGWTGPPALGRGVPDDTDVLILGGGIAGLTAAYELGRRGYHCTVLEAQERLGGRNRTARNGDELYEVDAAGDPQHTYTCTFDDGLYLNLGPGRIPYHHRRVLHYCSTFGVALEPYIMNTTANLATTRQPAHRWAYGRLDNDVRGRVAEALAELTDDEELTDLLRFFGSLDAQDEYSGSTRSGYSKPLDVHDFPKPVPPLSLREILDSGFWKKERPYHFYQPSDYLWQSALFQPVGGMDRIVEGFKRHLPWSTVTVLGAEVKKITLLETGRVRVDFDRGGTTQHAEAAYCVSNIPLSVLRNIELRGDFSGGFLDAVVNVPFEKTCKVGWQADRRFWEDDGNQIYGGISWVDDPITQIWYPSNDYFSPTGTGTLTGAYNFGAVAEAFSAHDPQKRLVEAREGAKKVHPEFGEEDVVPTGHGVSVAWHKVPHQLGGWAAWKPKDTDHQRWYKQLLQAEGGGRFFVTGDQASPLPGWQEGAMMSAQYVVGQMQGSLPLTLAPEVRVAVPDSVALTQGR